MNELADRFNEGKLDFTLLPLDALIGETKVWMMGEQKYGRDNWQKLYGDKTVQIVMASLLRHAYEILAGREIDEESGQHHGCHIRANAAMLIRYYNNTHGKEFATEEQHSWIQHYDYDPEKPNPYLVTIQTGTGKDSSET